MRRLALAGGAALQRSDNTGFVPQGLFQPFGYSLFSGTGEHQQIQPLPLRSELCAWDEGHWAGDRLGSGAGTALPQLLSQSTWCGEVLPVPGARLMPSVKPWLQFRAVLQGAGAQSSAAAAGLGDTRLRHPLQSYQLGMTIMGNGISAGCCQGIVSSHGGGFLLPGL